MMTTAQTRIEPAQVRLKPPFECLRAAMSRIEGPDATSERVPLRPDRTLAALLALAVVVSGFNSKRFAGVGTSFARSVVCLGV